MKEINNIAEELILDNVSRNALKKTYDISDMFELPVFYKYFIKFEDIGILSKNEFIRKKQVAIILKTIVHSKGILEDKKIEDILKNNFEQNEKRLLTFLGSRDLEEVFKKIPNLLSLVKENYDLELFVLNIISFDSKYKKEKKENIIKNFYTKKGE